MDLLCFNAFAEKSFYYNSCPFEKLTLLKTILYFNILFYYVLYLLVKSVLNKITEPMSSFRSCLSQLTYFFGGKINRERPAHKYHKYFIALCSLLRAVFQL